MKTKQNKAHVTFAFFGDYRPAYFAGKTTTEAIVIALSAISDPRLKDKLKSLAWDFTCARKGKLRVSAMSSESYDLGPIAIGIHDRPFQPWLGKVVLSMPVHPSLDYSKAEAN